MSAGLSYNKLTIFAIGLLFLTGVFLSAGFSYYLLSPTKKGGPDKVFFVSEGSTLKDVADELQTKEIIGGKSLFLFWARLMGYGRNIKAGEYLLNSGMSPLNILNILKKGAIITHPYTIPEGFTARQIGELYDKKGLLNMHEFLEAARDSDIAGHYGISGPGLEGYLYPDTYQFGLGLSPKAVINVMVKRFQEVIGPFRARAKQLGMTIEEVVILASIVEKETGRAEERPLIASVFLNRLKKRMRLESDPTVIYGLNGFNGNLTRKDLTAYTPYNTYVIPGLPPGPIANPGREAIRAVLYPAESDYLYFVSKNDGTHHFSKTLSEHNRAVEIYQKKRRKARNKSPQPKVGVSPKTS